MANKPGNTLPGDTDTPAPPSDPTPEPAASYARTSVPAPAAPPLTAADLQGQQGANIFMTMMDKLVDKLASAQMTPAALTQILKDVGESNAEMSRKARWPENAAHPAISAYSYPEGDVARPKPALSRKTFFCGIEEDTDRLTPAEIEGYNSLTQPASVRGGAWRAEIKLPKTLGAAEELLVWVPKETVDQRMMLPSLLLILHELNGGPSTADVMTLLQQIEGLKALLASKGVTAKELEDSLLGTH